MPLVPGVRLGAYEVVSLIGSGGMGEVYRARDERLGREVAVKVLAAGLATDAQRLQRFEQEARAAAALNHPNIVAVFDIGQHQGAPYIVAELLEGATLRERLVDGAPVRKAVEYAIQLALGLAAAHEKGIVHRDIKPENIFITADGRVKILDFGLAKLIHDESRAASLSVLPTTPPDTLPGAVLGTAGYMAPEQVRGLPADHRADVFACGAVLYEMLSGERAFRGDTTMDTMTAILREHPADLRFAERHIPAPLGRVVDRCIEKNPAERFQSARDVAFALEALSTHSDRGTLQLAAVDEPHTWRASRIGKIFRSARVAWSIAILALALATAIVLATFLRQSPEASHTPPIRTSILPVASEVPAGVNPIAVSPDGRQLAIASGGVLWIRRLDEIAARPLAGTQGAQAPFWSPDGRFVGYFARGQLQKTPVAGGASMTICNAELVPAGATWNRDDVLLFAMVSGPGDRRPIAMPVQRVSASGGTPQSISTPDEKSGEIWHLWPDFLPDGRHFLYFAAGPRDPKGIYLGSIDSPDRRLLVQGGSNARYANGQLFYLRASTLFAQPFDANALELSGEPVVVAEHVRISGSTGATGAFSVSSQGVLVYQTGENVPRLAWFDRSERQVSFGEPRSYHNVNLSPNNARVSVAVIDPVAGARDIWLVDTVNGSPTRFTFHAADENAAIWSPDGSRIVFNSNRNGHFDLYEKPSNLAGPEELLFRDDSEKYPLSWSSDGRYVLYQSVSRDADSGVHVWVLPLVGDRKPSRLLQEAEIDGHAQFSPDGRWVAYALASSSRTAPRDPRESGRPEVFVSRFPGAVGQWQISIGGGTHPRWSPDGKEIYYLALDARVMAVPFSIRDRALEPRPARPLFALFFPPQPGPASGRIGAQPLFSYDIDRLSQRFLVRTILQETAPITLVVNWPALLAGSR